MCAEKKIKKPGFIRSLLTLKCSRCRKGNMFKTTNSYDLKHFMEMNEKCPECRQPMDIEVGFYYGTGYISYALTIALSSVTFVLWWIFIGISIYDNRVFWWLGINVAILILLQPYLMRISRTIWLSIFVKYNPNWEVEKADEPERIVAGQMNNW